MDASVTAKTGTLSTMEIPADLPEPKLSDNALEVLKKRYLRKDADGKMVVETPKGLFWRVAWNIAQADRNYGADDAKVLEVARKFYEMMAKQLFLPNTPCLLNAGHPLQMLSACFPAGTPISTISGPRPIEDIVSGDLVLTHKGRYRSVLETMKRQDKLCKIKIHKLPVFFVTAEHPFLTNNGWVKAHELTNDHYVSIGQPAQVENLLEMPLFEEPETVCVEDGMVYVLRNGKSSTSFEKYKKTGWINRQISPIKEKINLDAESGWFFGMYLAEGCIDLKKHSIRFTLNLAETEYANRVAKILLDRFGLSSEIIRTVESPTSWLTVRTHSKLLSTWLFTHFSKGFSKKKLPEWINSTSTEFRRGLLDGVGDGDGTKVNVNQCRITLSNENLVRQLFEIAVTLGDTPTLQAEFVSEMATVPPWSVTIGGKAMFEREGRYKVKSVEMTDEVADVYNFEVEEDHTYVANQLVVHNCFVIPVEDSIDGIYDALKAQAKIQRSGGGCGFSFARLREEDALIETTKCLASGPISFMKVFDKSTEVVRQSGVRRGANMSILRCDSPDILDFIDMKLDPKEMTNFNVSVAVTDVFMEAFRNNGDYDLISPKNKKVVGRLNARVVMDKIAKNAWKSGEPGLFFIDEANRTNPVPHVGEIESTNPCLSADNWVETLQGPRQIKDIVGVPISVLVDKELFETSGFFQTGTKNVFILRTKEGYSSRLTEDHKIFKADGTKIPAKDLRPGDRLLLQSSYFGQWPGEGNEQEGYEVGLVVGDGFLNSSRPSAVIVTQERLKHEFDTAAERFKINGRIVTDKFTGRKEYRLESRPLRQLCEKFGVKIENKHSLSVIEKSSSDFYKGFLSAMFDTDGSIQGNSKCGHTIRLAQSNFIFLQGVQRMLLRFGINSSVLLRRKSGSKMMPDGRGGQKEYSYVDQWELIIYGSNLRQFDEKIGFRCVVKQSKLTNVLQTPRGWREPQMKATFVSLTPDGIEPVYDIQVPGPNRLSVGGIMTCNCGEIDLLPWDLCNLGSIAINRFVKRKLRPHPSLDSIMATIDWNRLRDAVHSAVHFLDNMIDMNKPPLPQIAEMGKGNRRTGLGVMGHAYMLYYLGIPYDSERGLEVTQSVMEFIQDAAVEASEKLGQDRGFYLHWKDGCPRRRNSYVTAIAPTGSISMIADTSGGCEPEFSLIWYKNVMDGTHLPYISEYFMEVAKREGFYDEKLKDDILSSVSDTGQPKHPGSCRGISRVPKIWQEVFAVSSDVAPEYHVRMQAAFQKYVHSAVSKTINMPKTATVEDVKKAYLLAYELKCKGITVYVDGSREHQVLNIGESTKKTESGKEALKIENPVATKTGSGDAVITTAKPTRRERPSSVSGTTQRVETGFGTLYVTVNEDDHGIIEVFATLGKTGGYTASFVEAIGRLASLLFASGMPLDAVVKQLAGIRSPKIAYDQKEKILSVPDAMAIALRRHLEQKISKNKEKDKKESGKSYGGNETNGTSSANGTALTTNSTNHSTFSDSEMAILQRIIEQPKDTHDEARQVIDKNGSPECSDCGGELTFSESCIKCLSCGYSEC